jgi:hypothetical protein
VRGVLLGGVALAALLTACDSGGGQPDDRFAGEPATTGVSATVTPTSAASSPDTATDSATATSEGTATTESSAVVRVFDQEAMQDAVLGILTDSYRLDEVSRVRCPGGRPVERGSTFDCTAQIGGERQRVPITVKSEQGDYEVGLPEPR